MIDLTEMTDEQLLALAKAAEDQVAQRQTAQVFEAQVEELYLSARSSGAIPTPEPGEQWQEPLSAHDAYVRGDVTTDNGKYFVSLRTPNMKRPSTSGGGMMTMSATSSSSAGPEWWQEVDPDDLPANEPAEETEADQYADVPDYEAPKEGDTHKAGDTVRFKGAIYEATRDTKWSPSYDPDAWEFIESEV